MQADVLRCLISINSCKNYNSQLFHMNLEENKLYIKVVVLDVIYNSVGEKFFFKSPTILF
jgi:hypothetical protein